MKLFEVKLKNCKLRDKSDDKSTKESSHGITINWEPFDRLKCTESNFAGEVITVFKSIMTNLPF